jgi:molecular chaperone GrpE
VGKVNKSDLFDADVEIEDEVKEPLAAELEGEPGKDPAAGEDLEKKLAEAQEEIADLHDRMLRAAAENENFKKRMERERSVSLKYAGEQIFREMLPVVDNLERAIELGESGRDNTGKNLESFLEGVKLTLKNLVSTLEKFEVKPIESLGGPFDPKHQEAMTMEPSDTVPANHVLTEFEKGYFYKDRLLRPAKVVVSAGNS